MASPHFIYVIGWNLLGPVKIGITTRVTKRLGALQSACPYPLKAFHIVKVLNAEIAFEIEQAALADMNASRLEGEWVSLSARRAESRIQIVAQSLGYAVAREHNELTDKARVNAEHIQGVIDMYKHLHT